MQLQAQAIFFFDDGGAPFLLYMTQLQESIILHKIIAYIIGEN